MEDKFLLEAVESISLIRAVIERTSKSFTAFSQIFIYWGLLFLVNAVAVTALVSSPANSTVLYPLLTYALPIVRVLAAVIIYIWIVRGIPLIGLEKKLMNLWILVLAMNMLPPRINLVTSEPLADMAWVSIQYSNLPIVLFSLAIALIATSMITSFKPPNYMGIAFVAVSVIISFFPVPLFDTLIHLYPLPLTLLFVGFFLKSQPVQAGV